jgi:hypothetical protein
MKFAYALTSLAAVAIGATSFQAHAAEQDASRFNQVPAVQLARSDAMPRQTQPRDNAATYYADPGKRGAHAAALQSPEALRRYIDRTRMIYGLDYAEFARD